jgi:hypothetical protein
MAASYPGLPEEFMRTGMVIVTVGARDAHIAAYPADSAGVQCKLLGQATGSAAAAAPGRRAERLQRRALRACGRWAVGDRPQYLAPALMGVA